MDDGFAKRIIRSDPSDSGLRLTEPVLLQTVRPENPEPVTGLPEWATRIFRKVTMIQFLIHEKADTVGVATVDIKQGETAQGLYMDSQEAVTVKALQDIPLGHKIAMKDHKVEDTVYKYGYDIGRIVANVKVGEHVHIHNLKTRRW